MMDNNFASILVAKFISGQNAKLPLSRGHRSEANTRIRDDLPDGSCFSRVLQVTPNECTGLNSETTLWKCEYVGSFAVTGSDYNERAEFVHSQLGHMKVRYPRKSVLLVISLTGLKVCIPDGKSVLMAHALKRISFATCDPDSCHFSFLAREPNGHFSLQYCHTFVMKTSCEAEELSRVVGAAFRMAYAQQLAQPLSSLQSETCLRPSQTQFQQTESITTFLAGSLPGHQLQAGTCEVENATCSPPRPAIRACWAKKLVGKTKHHDPMAEQAMEMSNRSSSSNTPSSSSWNLAQEGRRDKNDDRNQPENGVHSSPLEHRIRNHEQRSSSPSERRVRNVNRAPSNLPMVHSPPSCGGSSSEEGNSPTDLNSCKQIKDKPQLTKNLDDIQELSVLNGAYCKVIGRPSSGIYLNEGSSPTRSPNHVHSLRHRNGKSEARNNRKASRFNIKFQGPCASSAPLSDEEISLDSSGESKRSLHLSSELIGASYSSSFAEASPLNRGHYEPDVNSKRCSHSSTNCCATPPPPPERFDSLNATISEDEELRDAPWFQAGIPREIALEILSQESVGSFMVRESTSKPGCFALSLRVPNDFHESGIAHYLIMKINRGYKIKGFTKEFGTLSALITHHSVMPELLPCPLSLTRYNPAFKKHDSGDMVDINEDPDYHLLSDFRKMLADINV